MGDFGISVRKMGENMTEQIFGDLSVISMRGAEDFTAQVDSYLKEWRNHDNERSFIAETACPRFGSGEGKGIVKNSLRGKDEFSPSPERSPCR